MKPFREFYAEKWGRRFPRPGDMRVFSEPGNPSRTISVEESIWESVADFLDASELERQK